MNPRNYQTELTTLALTETARDVFRLAARSAGDLAEMITEGTMAIDGVGACLLLQRMFEGSAERR